MAKGARPKHLQARVAFLDEAAKLVAREQFRERSTATSLIANDEATAAYCGLPLWLASTMRTVAKRSQIRLEQGVKRDTCKKCSTPQLHGITSRTFVDNASKGGIKPWADIKIVECANCGSVKRFPVGAKRQSKKKHRRPDPRKELSAASSG